MSWEVPEPDCPPVTIKLLGEELVAFRDTNGKVGVVGARCAHRRAHLFWGRNEECGIKCVYHGWKFDVEGRCTDMPSEPAESNFKDKVRIPAYPTYEVAGLVFCFMGPPEKKPSPPLFQWTQVPAENRAMSKIWQQCNWLQALEGGIDNVHYLPSQRPPARYQVRRVEPAQPRPQRLPGAQPGGRPDGLRLHLWRRPGHGQRRHEPCPRLPLDHALEPDPRFRWQLRSHLGADGRRKHHGLQLERRLP
jgi:phenylpropionate dioxygenase-like ring-hydroxylating dioxygenase large terminal subunit